MPTDLPLRFVWYRVAACRWLLYLVAPIVGFFTGADSDLYKS